MTTTDELLDLYRQSGALLEGHFRLTSGLHSPGYLQCALVLQHPAASPRRSAARSPIGVRDLRPTVVLSPALGGVVIGQEVGRALGVRAIFAERQDGALTLRRGFTLGASDRVLVVEDVMTTGGSTRETIAGGRGRGRARRRRRVDRRSQRRQPARPRRAVPVAARARAADLTPGRVPALRAGRRRSCKPRVARGDTVPRDRGARILKIDAAPTTAPVSSAGSGRRAACRFRALLEEALARARRRRRSPCTGPDGPTPASTRSAQVASVTLTRGAPDPTPSCARSTRGSRRGPRMPPGRAPPGFHARFDAARQDLRLPDRQRADHAAVRRGYAWHVPQPLDVEAMRAGRAAAGRAPRLRRVPGHATAIIEDTIARGSSAIEWQGRRRGTDASARRRRSPPTAFSATWSASSSARWWRSGGGDGRRVGGTRS